MLQRFLTRKFKSAVEEIIYHKTNSNIWAEVDEAEHEAAIEACVTFGCADVSKSLANSDSSV